MEYTERDYLHLYIGHAYAIIKRDMNNTYKFDYKFLKWYLSNKIVEEGDDVPDTEYKFLEDISIIIRPMHTITDEECIELCKINNPLPFGATKNWIVELEEETQFKTVKAKLNDYVFDVDLTSGNLTVYQNDDITYNHFTAQQTQYLLSKGLDCYGLIEKGMATDAGEWEYDPYKFPYKCTVL